jgi:23S rRNA pseudouridine2605 synthase
MKTKRRPTEPQDRTPRRPQPKAKSSRAKPNRADTDAAGERVQKILARAGLASRREAEEWIRAGRISVNGEAATLGTRAKGSDQLRLDGRLIHQAPVSRSATWLCHRSPGENLLPPRAGDEDPDTADDAEERGAVSQRLSRRVGRRYIPISPMPRGDGGLELLTSDGALAAKLQRAMRGLQVEFSLRVRGELSPGQIQGVLAGRLDSGDALQVLECEPTGGEGANRWYRIVAVGANGRDLHQLLERLDVSVSRMLRVAMGGLKLERTLGRGQVRQLEEAEIALLLAAPPQK